MAASLLIEAFLGGIGAGAGAVTGAAIRPERVLRGRRVSVGALCSHSALAPGVSWDARPTPVLSPTAPYATPPVSSSQGQIAGTNDHKSQADRVNYWIPLHAGVAKLAERTGLKIPRSQRVVWVRFPPPALPLRW